MDANTNEIKSRPSPYEASNNLVRRWQKICETGSLSEEVVALVKETVAMIEDDRREVVLTCSGMENLSRAFVEIAEKHKDDDTGIMELVLKPDDTALVTVFEYDGDAIVDTRPLGRYEIDLDDGKYDTLSDLETYSQEWKRKQFGPVVTDMDAMRTELDAPPDLELRQALSRQALLLQLPPERRG